MSHPAGASKSQSGAGRPAAAVRMSPAALLVLLIRGYQRFLSPLLGPRCRFVPSCSEYAAEALQRHGALRGLWLTCWRLLRCQPFCRGGYDPVPPQRDRSAARGRLRLTRPRERGLCVWELCPARQRLRGQRGRGRGTWAGAGGAGPLAAARLAGRAAGMAGRLAGPSCPQRPRCSPQWSARRPRGRGDQREGRRARRCPRPARARR